MSEMDAVAGRGAQSTYTLPRSARRLAGRRTSGCSPPPAHRARASSGEDHTCSRTRRRVARLSAPPYISEKEGKRPLTRISCTFASNLVEQTAFQSSTLSCRRLTLRSSASCSSKQLIGARKIIALMSSKYGYHAWRYRGNEQQYWRKRHVP